MSNLREMSKDEIAMVTGGNSGSRIPCASSAPELRLTGLYQDEGGTWAVYIDGGGNITDVLVDSQGGDQGWLDIPRDNNSDNSGYFGTLGLSLWGSLGGSLSVDSGGNFYGGASVRVGTPITLQGGFSPDVRSTLTGASVTLASGNPGVPVVNIDLQNGELDLGTTIVGTPSAEIGIGIELGNPIDALGQTFNDLASQLSRHGTVFLDGFSNWIRYGDNGIVPPSIEPQR